MKRIVLATALFAATAVGAFAQQASVSLPAAVQAQIVSRIPGIDLSALTSEQVDRLGRLFANPDDLRPGNDLTGTVRSILDNAQ